MYIDALSQNYNNNDSITVCISLIKNKNNACMYNIIL